MALFENYKQMNKSILYSLVIMFAFTICGCKKKEVPLVQNGYYFDYKEYGSSKFGGCVAGGIINNTWDVNLVNIPASGTTNVSLDYYFGDCTDCCGIRVTNYDMTTVYFAVSGTVWRDGPLVGFDVLVRDEKELDSGRDIILKGSYVCGD